MCSTLKRPFGVESADEVDGMKIKIAKLSQIFRLKSESEPESDWEDKESIQSFQMAETASPHDTSDTTDKSEEEYSVDSQTEVEVPEVSSGSDEICIVGNFNDIVSEFGSEISVVADLSDSDSTSGDSETGPGEYWKCLKCLLCHTTNKNPRVRYCEKCFRQRRSTCPPRPKHKKRKSKRGKLTTSSGGSVSEGQIVKDDSGLGLSQPSSEDIPLDPICKSCYERPANGVFVHQKTGHQVFCYKCSQRISIERNRCPICNQPILRVVQIYKANNLLGEH